MKEIHVQMLGQMNIRYQDTIVGENYSRSYKMWNMLAYLIYHRHRTISQQELISVIWGEEEQKSLVGAFKTLLYRLRDELNRLWPDAGKKLIRYQNKGYRWNPDYPVHVDIDEFNVLCSKMEAEEYMPDEEDIKTFSKYEGDFLSSLSSEAWVVPVSIYYHDCYTKNLMRLLEYLKSEGNYEQIIELCNTAVMLEPYNEKLHAYYMGALIKTDNQKQAVAVYEAFNKKLKEDFLMMPAEELRSLYLEAKKTHNDTSITMEILKEQMKEKNNRRGALICEYDFFCVLYQSVSRSMARIGMTVHIAILTIGGAADQPVVSRRLKGYMRNLEEQIRVSLRRGDVAAECSPSQFVIMLPQANYENSCMVCERIIKAFNRKHPHTSVSIRYEVSAVEQDDGTQFIL